MTDFKQLKKDIQIFCRNHQIDKVGFTTADPFTSLKRRLYQQKNLGYHTGFEEKDIEKRTEPELLMDDAQSIISVALAYPAKMDEKPENIRGDRRGSFCRASWGTDYHYVLKDRLEALETFIKDKVPGAKVTSMVDTGELSDRAVAERAGVGVPGKNTNLITEEFGSYVYLGEMVTNIPFEPDEPLEDLCGDCNLCVDRCPTGALVQGGQLNAQKCIAYLTQTKGYVPEPYRQSIGNRVYGCDTCQQVCPYNRGVNVHNHEEMEPDPERVKPELISLLTISQKQFKKQFGTMSGSWRGKKPIQRNAVIALGNYKEVSAIDDLTQRLHQDPKPVIRGTAAWALGRIYEAADSVQRATIKDALEQALTVEEDETVIDECKQASVSIEGKRTNQ
ncbi:tRNA epoxyqueuosine(34) reductase QueG [Tuberibacillus sp. Marseille-P3662]|uniref:tRNA epoxyqueuosine(34) reductase QueG n=1 Tax=Tuberibacillus sp. Marseille-P3662 TaxID=1965358 RepID=UPI000A1CBFFB|nr:tRNA epoxyqueuosine(34) reductase QueG [Tuberibacillus sp. Marseille-P3662]